MKICPECGRDINDDGRGLDVKAENIIYDNIIIE